MTTEKFEPTVMTTEKLDFFFRCNYCIKLIGQNEAVYMHRDSSYCSTTCKSRGRSTLYKNLTSIQMERMQKIRQTSQGTLSSTVSESSVGSPPRYKSAKEHKSLMPQHLSGTFNWVINKVFDAISNQLPVLPLVKAASYNMFDRIHTVSSISFLLGHLPRVASILHAAE